MKLKKKRKSVRLRGSTGHGRGFKKKGRGKGHRGGKGMSGTGKRADHRKPTILNYAEEYFGKKGLKAGKKKYKIVNLTELEKMADGKKELKIVDYKILAKGEISKPLTIIAYSASKSAIKKIEKAGGKVTLKADQEEEK